ncbi:MAG: flagellar basal body L-ring protein FlgH [Planctomycetota bacterium]|nr:MAG: flagellar basal body L-ring protein FlgH [Planctomycetota bacterium]
MRIKLQLLSCGPLLALALLCVHPLAAESLVTATNLSHGTMYSDQVARQAGDLLTIRVNENTQVAESQKTDTSREMALSGRIRALPNSTLVEGAPGAPTKGTLPVFGAESAKEFTGEGSYDQRGRMSAMITGRVIDVLDNGNLVIEGRRTLTFGANLKTIRITGVVRTADITSGNLVESERIHNLQVAIEGEGPLNRSQQQGLLSRLLDYIWPL